MYNFDYVRPASIADASAAAQNPDAKFIAGGQTLLPTLRQRLARPAALIDLGRIADLKGIHRNGSAIGIGATTTHAEVATSPVIREALPALAYLAGQIGDAQVRHRGTIGGSLANNDPAADYPAAVLALGATIVTDRRQIPADDYFTGLFSTALQPGEIITGVGFQIPEKAGYAKFAQRASRYALVGVFVAKFGPKVRVAVTGAGESGVFREGKIETALAKDFRPEAASGINVNNQWLMSDLHGSNEYRGALIPVMAERAVAQAIG
jgi:carbon-monoxide dehydrogenase medium subunit